MNKTSDNFAVAKSSYMMNSLKEEEQESSVRGDRNEDQANFSDSSPMKINKSYNETN